MEALGYHYQENECTMNELVGRVGLVALATS